MWGDLGEERPKCEWTFPWVTWIVRTMSHIFIMYTHNWHNMYAFIHETHPWNMKNKWPYVAGGDSDLIRVYQIKAYFDPLAKQDCSSLAQAVEGQEVLDAVCKSFCFMVPMGAVRLSHSRRMMLHEALQLLTQTVWYDPVFDSVDSWGWQPGWSSQLYRLCWSLLERWETSSKVSAFAKMESPSPSMVPIWNGHKLRQQSWPSVLGFHSRHEENWRDRYTVMLGPVMKCHRQTA